MILVNNPECQQCQYRGWSLTRLMDSDCPILFGLKPGQETLCMRKVPKIRIELRGTSGTGFDPVSVAPRRTEPGLDPRQEEKIPRRGKMVGH